MKRKFISISVTIAVAVSLILVVAAYLNSISIMIPSTGTLKTINITAWKDPNCTVPLTELVWNETWLATSYNQTGYILSEGNAPLLLNMTYGNWTFYHYNGTKLPDYSSHVNFTWNLEGTWLQPGVPEESIFTLIAHRDIPWYTRNFYFEIILNGYIQ